MSKKINFLKPEHETRFLSECFSVLKKFKDRNFFVNVVSLVNSGPCCKFRTNSIATSLVRN